MPLELLKEFRTGVPIFDEQHEKLVASLNHLYAEVNKMEAGDKFNELLQEFINYGMAHFATEEKYFDDYGYPGAAEQKEQHQEFKKKMLEFAEQIKKTDKTKLAFELVEYMENWLVYHLQTVDQKYIEFFKEKGVAK